MTEEQERFHHGLYHRAIREFPKTDPENKNVLDEAAIHLPSWEAVDLFVAMPTEWHFRYTHVTQECLVFMYQGMPVYHQGRKVHL